MIRPTIGRVVWYFEDKDKYDEYMKTKDGQEPLSQPWAMLITYVHGDHLVNVAGWNTYGTAMYRNSLRLWQEGDDAPVGSFVSWMPYQLASAKAWGTNGDGKPDTAPSKDGSVSGEKHAGLPVAGYKPQSGTNVLLVNENKALEERVLRQLDVLANDASFDKRWLAIGRTAIENGFMAVNRAVFQPTRTELPEDKTPKAGPYDYRKKASATVKAWLWHKGTAEPKWAQDAPISYDAGKGTAFVKTLHGNVEIKEGDWLLWQGGDDYYPVKNDVFTKTYDPA